MKKIILIVLAAAFLAACSSNPKTTDSDATESTSMAAEWVEVVLNVEGMTCDGCEKAIKAGVSTLDGIESVKSSFEEGWTKVKYDKNLTSLEDIEGKISDTGYVVEGEKTSVSL